MNDDSNETMAARRRRQVASLLAHGQMAWVLKAPARKTAGRYPKTELERLRFKFWYWWLRSRCPPEWSDLDMAEVLGLDGSLRTIDRMRRLGLAPRSIWTRPAPANVITDPEFALVEKADRNPRFKGARACLESQFWTFFGKPASTQRRTETQVLRDNQPDSTTDSLRNVRLNLNEFMGERNLVRLEGDLNTLVDEQVESFVRRANIEDSSRSSARLYTQWLYKSLSTMNAPLERLTFVGLLLRESVLLGMVEQAYLILKIFKEEINGALPKIDCKSESKKAQYETFLAEFRKVVLAYVQRGHLDLSQETGFYADDPSQAVKGYILHRHSGFLSQDDERAYEEWETVLLREREFMDAFIGIGKFSQFSPPMDID